MRGNIWLAETGGIVSRPLRRTPASRRTPPTRRWPTSFLLETLGALSPRIQRIYLYEWDAQRRADSWDTALISYTGAPRESYVVLAQTLYSWGIRAELLDLAGAADVHRARRRRQRHRRERCDRRDAAPTGTSRARAAPRGTTGATGATGATGWRDGRLRGAAAC